MLLLAMANTDIFCSRYESNRTLAGRLLKDYISKSVFNKVFMAVMIVIISARCSDPNLLRQ